jgi:hypothetical protein
LLIHALNNAGGMGDNGVGADATQVIGRQTFEDFVREAVGGGERELERGVVGNAGAVEIGGGHAFFLGEGTDLRGSTVNKHDADVQGAQHGDVQQERGEILIGDDGAIDREDEGLLPELGNVLQDTPQVSQFHVGSLCFGTN